MMRSGEKQKIIDQSLIKCHLNNETPKDRGEVKLYELSQGLVLLLSKTKQLLRKLQQKIFHTPK